MAFLGTFSGQTMATLAIVTGLSWPVGFFFLELIRLSRHSDLLKNVLDSEKHYEVILAEARRERDELRESINGLQIRDLIATYDLAPDGQRFLMVKESAAGDDAEGPAVQIILVRNWFEELKRLVPVD